MRPRARSPIRVAGPVAASTETQAVDTTASTMPRGAGRAGSPLTAERWHAQEWRALAEISASDVPSAFGPWHSDFGIVIAAAVISLRSFFDHD